MFLRARLDEAAQEARAAGGGEWTSAPGHGDNAVIVGPDDGIDITGDTCDEVGAHIARHGPAAVLRDIEAKRRIIDLHEPVPHALTVEEGGGSYLACAVCPHPQIDVPHVPPCETLRLVGLPDDKHPDYREEWKP